MIAKKLKQVFENKKRTSNKNISCLKKEVCYNNLMLKTISYSVMFVSSIVEKIRQTHIFDNNDDDIFTSLNNKSYLRTILQDLFNEPNIDIERMVNSINVKQYKSTNGFVFTFEYPYKLTISTEQQDGIKCQSKKDLDEIANKILSIIKNEYKDQNVINEILINYRFVDNCINPSGKIKSLLTIDNNEIDRSVMVLTYKKNKDIDLMVKFYDDINKKDTIIYDTLLDCSNISKIEEITNILSNEETEQYIRSKIEAINNKINQLEIK